MIAAMSITRQSLAENFKLLRDDELLALFHSGDLTDLAQEVAAAELQQRGIDLSKPIVQSGTKSEATPGSGDLVPVARFFTAAEAQMLQSRLELEGVPAVVADAHMVHLLMSTAIGGVRVLVPESHLERAREIASAVERGDYALDDNTDAG
jgi:hypothetical protein